MPRQLLVVLARPALADVAGQGFLQDPDFLYLTGLRQAVGAVLVLDGPAAESRLFQPTSLGPFADHVGLKVDGAAETSGLDDIATWDQLVPYLRRRVGEAKVADIRLARAGMLEAIVATIGTPPGLTPGAGARAHLKRALAEAIPGTPIEDDVLLSEMRLVKSPAEIDLLRRAGAASAAALLAGMGSIGPGHRQREAEAAIVGTCLKQADGVSFWPWAMSGPAAVYPEPWKSLKDPLHLDRRMESGALVRVDVGCAYGGYMGDVGRTVPVSGRYDAEQRETWELLIGAYGKGLEAVRDGARVGDVVAASRQEIARRQDRLRTTLARRAAVAILAPDGAPHWQVHGIGLDPAEGPSAPTDVLRAGMVVAYEPIFDVEGQGFYLEDMLVVTATGHELLTQGLPYTADDVERVMQPKPGRVKEGEGE
jgi:Xaa-Pro aminopeptidase